jgi:hypothetical protein
MTKAVMKLAHVTQTLVQGGVWWHLPVIPALGRQRQEEAEVSSLKVAGYVVRPYLKNTKKPKKRGQRTWHFNFC